jgi:hypothetical protein
MNKGTFRALAALFLVCGATHLKAAVLYNQPTDNQSGWYSQNDTSIGGKGNYDTVFDNFTLGSSATILSVTWVGSYNGPAIPGTMTGVTIDIFADNAGVPNYLSAPLYSQHIAGDASEAFLGHDVVTNPTYTYSANVNFAATGGTQYWLSIVSDVPNFNGWAWETSSAGDGNAYQIVFGGFNQRTTDFAFGLYSTSLPEPATTAMVGGGLILLGLIFRRRR